MRAKVDPRKKTAALRKKGLSYAEIQKKIPVSKSSLSLWLRDIRLTQQQKDRLKEKSRANQHLGAKANKQKRIQRTQKIKEQSKKDINKITNREFLYLGAMLYWAEGSKQKPHNPSERISINNSDPLMIKMFIKWLIDTLEVAEDRIVFSIYSHNNIKHREKRVIKYWSNVTGFSKDKFAKIYYKKDKKKKYRKNQGFNYHGLLRVSVTKSTDLNRKISGWIEGICEHCGVV